MSTSFRIGGRWDIRTDFLDFQGNSVTDSREPRYTSQVSTEEALGGGGGSLLSRVVCKADFPTLSLKSINGLPITQGSPVVLDHLIILLHFRQLVITN